MINVTLQKLHKKLNSLRSDLENARPKLKPMRRPFTYLVDAACLPAIQKGKAVMSVETTNTPLVINVTDIVEVQLYQFNAKPGIESYCYGLGKEIKATKALITREVDNLEKRHRTFGRRALMRLDELREVERIEKRKQVKAEEALA